MTPHAQPNPNKKPRVLDPDSETLLDQAARVGSFVLNHIDRANYVYILKNLYHIVMDSVPFMEHATRILDANSSPFDTYHHRYRAYLDHHIEEERDHDIWLLEDLAALKNAHIHSDARPISPHIAQLMANHWHALHNHNPWQLLGHMWALESRPPSASGLLNLRTRLGLTPEMTRTYDRHAADDPHHAHDVAALISNPALPDTIRADITVGARITAANVTRFWLDLSNPE